MEREKRNYENDDGYTSPRAWHHLKQALAKMGNHLSPLGDQFQAETETAGGCIRLRLAVVFHHWLSLGTEAQMEAFKAYFGWSEANKEQRKNPSTVARAPQNADAAQQELHMEEPWEKEGEEWKQAGRAPSEELPDAEKASPQEFLEAVWSVMAPPGWKIPHGLPADARLTSDLTRVVPIIISGNIRPISEGGINLKMHCPVCGKGYRQGSMLFKHQVKVHGWGRDAKGHSSPSEYIAGKAAQDEK